MADGKKLDLSQPVGQMSSDELLAWGAKELAGGFIGGIGGLVFNKVWEANSARPVPLSSLLEDQLKKFQAMLRKAIEENALRELRASADALSITMSNYKNAPRDDRLETATRDAVMLVSQTMSLKVNAFQTFLHAAGLHLTVLAERRVRFDAPGELVNIKQSLERYIGHCKRMREDGKKFILNSMESGDIREIGDGGVWDWVYCIRKDRLASGLNPLGTTDAEIASRFDGRRRGREGPEWQYPRIVFDGSAYDTRWFWVIEYYNHSGGLSRAEAVQLGGNNGARIRREYEADREWMRSIFDTETAAEIVQDRWSTQLETL